jgi:hypothetical protein
MKIERTMFILQKETYDILKIPNNTIIYLILFHVQIYTVVQI